ncbi:MAG: ABC transporter ATP-binding protein/permease [Gemmatimonadaceae bacterium]|nr:ABC transporter ATP-binding protein/permease [Acetobacteraceae bacterium]
MPTDQPFLRDAWRLALPYFQSEEKWSARILLASIITLNLSLVGMTVVLNYWNGAFYDSLQNKDWDLFLQLLFTYRSGPAGFMPGFVPIVCVLIPISIYRTYLNQWLQIRWRRWMTDRLLTDWLSDRAYYTISLTTDPAGTGTDNPDQRIAEDLRRFVEDTLRLSLGLLSNVVSLFNFALILWTLSGSVTLWGVTIPGYMLFAAILYAALGSVLTHYVGRPLAALEFQQEKAEADFRFSLARLRENTEGIALYGGERAEKASLTDRFVEVFVNWRRLMNRQKFLNALIAGYEQAAAIFPIVVAAPRYFSGEIALGGLTRTAGAFARVQNSLSWFIDAYAALASWRATTVRLASFKRAIDTARGLADKGTALRAGNGTGIAADGMALSLPDGTPMIEQTGVLFPQGQSTVISGRSGSGKSTLFRALAGIWPYGHGTIERPPGQYLFLPQRPYIPLGTLRHALMYPAEGQVFDERAVHGALNDAGLGALIPRLDEDQPWAQRLSGGEQQRLAVARALLLRPDWLFMDEATASLDPEAEGELYATLRRNLPDTTIISIAHRPAVAAFHDTAQVFRRTQGQPGVLETQAG